MITVTLKKSKHGPTYIATITGKVGKVAVKGNMRQWYKGIDLLETHSVNDLCTINRAEGGALTYNMRFQVVKAVEDKLRAIGC